MDIETFFTQNYENLNLHEKYEKQMTIKIANLLKINETHESLFYDKIVVLQCDGL